ncbi:CAP-Gly domain-containing linker protein 1 homolog [Tachypleus tridentatus]|uniref:CAP-Gly domain-containing linker protein 1 homolog n=1 Tax=Tachypleus tridentatus TaxID=6853 RepID=UPI003FD6917E
MMAQNFRRKCINFFRFGKRVKNNHRASKAKVDQTWPVEGFYHYARPGSVQNLDALSHSSTLLEWRAQQSDCGTQLEQLRRNRAEEIQEPDSKLTTTHKEETETLDFNHHEEFRKLRAEYDKEIEDLKNIHAQSVRDAENENTEVVAALKVHHNLQIEELEKDFAKQMQLASESNEKAVKILKQQLQDLQKQMESSLHGDTNMKLQRILDEKCYLEKEVESLQTVLEFKVADIHRLRKENLEMQKELDKLPSAKREIEKLKARNEDLRAMLDEKFELREQRVFLVS